MANLEKLEIALGGLRAALFCFLNGGSVTTAVEDDRVL